jgi:hypothetical protein
VADKRYAVGEMKAGASKSPTYRFNTHQAYMGPYIADVEKTMLNNSGSSKTGKYSEEGFSERLGGAPKRKLCDEDEFNEKLLSPSTIGQRRKRELGSVVRSITTELEGNSLGSQTTIQDGSRMVEAAEQPRRPQ